MYYDDSAAPSFQNEIAAGVANWNSSVANVKLEENPGAATLDFREGNDPRGSYAYTDGHGNGNGFLDFTQMGQYAPVRITAHETGHVLGLPDHYEGPCSELMSGGGSGPTANCAEGALQHAQCAEGALQRISASAAATRPTPSTMARSASPA